MFTPEYPSPLGQDSSQQPKVDVFRIGDRIPLFKISGAKIDPESPIQTYKASLLLATTELTDLSFSVSLGHFLSGLHNNPRQLRVEGDLSRLVDEELAVREVRRRRGFSFGGPFEQYSYSYSEEVQPILGSLRFRIFDGENGKVYEAGSSHSELKFGRLVFEHGFREVQLDENGQDLWHGVEATPMGYKLNQNTGAESTEAIFIKS